MRLRFFLPILLAISLLASVIGHAVTYPPEGTPLPARFEFNFTPGMLHPPIQVQANENLPNVSLGYVIYQSAGTPIASMRDLDLSKPFCRLDQATPPASVPYATDLPVAVRGVTMPAKVEPVVSGTAQFGHGRIFADAMTVYFDRGTTERGYSLELTCFWPKPAAQVGTILKTSVTLSELREILGSVFGFQYGSLAKQGAGVAPTFEASSNLVLVDPRVRDAETKEYRTDLSKMNFEVYEGNLCDKTKPKEDLTIHDGIPGCKQAQLIDFSSASKSLPVNLFVVVDLSGSTESVRPIIQRAVEAFVKNSDPRDTITLAAFGNEFRVVLPMTRDRTAAMAGVAQLMATKVGQQTMDGFLAAIRYVATNYPGQRNALVFITDGEINVNCTPAGDSAAILSEALAAQQILFTVDVSASQNDEPSELMKLYGEKTGGAYEFAKNYAGLEDKLDDVLSLRTKLYHFALQSVGVDSNGKIPRRVMRVTANRKVVLIAGSGFTGPQFEQDNDQRAAATNAAVEKRIAAEDATLMANLPRQAHSQSVLGDDSDSLKMGELQAKKAKATTPEDEGKIFDQMLLLSNTPAEVFQALDPGVPDPSPERQKLISDLAMAYFDHFVSVGPTIAELNRYKAYASTASAYKLITAAAVRLSTNVDEFFLALEPAVPGTVPREELRSAAGEVAIANATRLTYQGGKLADLVHLKAYARNPKQYGNATDAALSFAKTPAEFFAALEPASGSMPDEAFRIAADGAAVSSVGHLIQIGGKIPDLNRMKPLARDGKAYGRLCSEGVKLASNADEFFLALTPSVGGNISEDDNRAITATAFANIQKLVKMGATPEQISRMKSYAGNDLALQSEVEHTFGGNLAGIRTELNAMKGAAKTWDEEVEAFGQALKLARGPADFFVALESGTSAADEERAALIRRLAIEKIDLLVSLGGGPSEIPKMMTYARGFADQVTIVSHLAASCADFDVLKAKAMTWDDKFRVYSAALAMAKSTAQIEIALGFGNITPDRETASIVGKLAVQAAGRIAAAGGSADSVRALKRFASSQSEATAIETKAQALK